MNIFFFLFLVHFGDCPTFISFSYLNSGSGSFPAIENLSARTFCSPRLCRAEGGGLSSAHGVDFTALAMQSWRCSGCQFWVFDIQRQLLSQWYQPSCKRVYIYSTATLWLIMTVYLQNCC